MKPRSRGAACTSCSAGSARRRAGPRATAEARHRTTRCNAGQLVAPPDNPPSAMPAPRRRRETAETTWDGTWRQPAHAPVPAQTSHLFRRGGGKPNPLQRCVADLRRWAGRAQIDTKLQSHGESSQQTVWNRAVPAAQRRPRARLAAPHEHEHARGQLSAFSALPLRAT